MSKIFNPFQSWILDDPKNLQKSSGQVRHWAATSAVPGSILLVLFGDEPNLNVNGRLKFEIEVRHVKVSCLLDHG